MTSPKPTQPVFLESVSGDLNSIVQATTDLALMGVSAREDSGGAGGTASFDVVDGQADSGNTLLRIEFAANESLTKWFGPTGIEVLHGLSINHIEGTLGITLFVRR